MLRHRSEGLTYNEMMEYCFKKLLSVINEPKLLEALLKNTKEMMGLEFVQELKEKIKQHQELI